MRFRVFAVCGALLFALVMTACNSKEKEIQRILESPISYRSHVAPTADFARYSTWGWIPAVPASVTPNPRGEDPDIRRAVEREVTRHMEARGYTQTTDSPTIVVNYHVADRDIDSDYLKQMYDGKYYPEYRIGFSGPNKARSRWQEGELVVFIFDTQTRDMVWQGSAMAEVTIDAELDRRLERLSKAIRTMFTSFPGKPRVQPHESTGGSR